MYAVVKTGGKQYRVAKDDIIKIERLPGEAGDTITLNDVLMVGDGDKVEVGAPMLDGAAVAGEILEQGRGKKIVIFKKRRRQNYRPQKGPSPGSNGSESHGDFDRRREAEACGQESSSAKERSAR